MKRLFLSILLIVCASSILLVMDLENRQKDKAHIPNIAVLQYSSHTFLDDGVAGILDGLMEKGMVDGKNINIKHFNSEGDMPTANAIAKEITSGKYDYALTVSTPALQAVANANKDGKVIQIFGVVTDPFIAGVGLEREHPEIHPRHLLGYGSFLPVKKLIDMAMKLNPHLKIIGLAWNASEANSEAYTLLAREYTKKLGLKLDEVIVDSSSAVYEAVNALVSRGAEVILVTGDNTVGLALNSVVDAANKGNIPVITLIPTSPNKGTLLDLGANFYEVGKLQGQLAARLISGEDPASIPIENLVPEVLTVNKKVFRKFKDHWTLPEDIEGKADIVIDEEGNEIKKQDEKNKKTTINDTITKKWNIHIVEYTEFSDVEETRNGFLEGLKSSGLKEGKDYSITVQNAQGDMPTVNLMIDNALSQGADMLVTLSTPALQAAIQRAKIIPVIFTYCASGVNAGAGRTNEDHLPNITGIYALAAYNEMITLFSELMPAAKKIGTIFVPSEANSVMHNKILGEETRKAGIELVSIPANNSTDVPDAALALTASGIDAVIQIPGNLTAVSFTSIAKAAIQAGLPIFAFQTVQSGEGASVVLARDYDDFGRETAYLAVRVMRGENPKNIPFTGLEETKLILNLKAAKNSNLKIPEKLIKKAYKVVR